MVWTVVGKAKWRRQVLECKIYQAEGVVYSHELFYAVLLKHHDVGQVGATLTCAVLTVNHVCFPAVVLACHKQQIEHLDL